MTKIRVWSSEKVYYCNEVDIEGEVTEEKIENAINKLIDEESFDANVVNSEIISYVDDYKEID